MQEETRKKPTKTNTHVFKQFGDFTSFVLLAFLITEFGVYVADSQARRC